MTDTPTAENAMGSLQYIFQATAKIEADRKTHNDIGQSLKTLERYIQSTAVPTAVDGPAKSEPKTAKK